MNDNHIVEQYLRSQNISQELIGEIEEFRKEYDCQALFFFALTHGVTNDTIFIDNE